MCGIVGLFLKDKVLEPRLGDLIADMLITMTDRGPDSAGIAIYNPEVSGMVKITIQSPQPERDFKAIKAALDSAKAAATGDATGVTMVEKSTHAVLSIAKPMEGRAREIIASVAPDVRIMGSGECVEIYKEIGLPVDVVERFSVRSMGGTHAVGHTRMATESAVTTLGAHPFSTGADQCLVHNGSLSNHNNLRRSLIHDGMRFETANDSEVAAAYLSNQMARGKSLGAALESALDDLDGFFTFVVGTKSGFGVVRDAIACKPAVMAETDQYVAFGSEYRALASLPGIETARVWEPEPATVYFWDHAKAA